MKIKGKKIQEIPFFNRIITIVQDIASIYKEYTVKILLGALCVLIILLIIAIAVKSSENNEQNAPSLDQRYIDRIEKNPAKENTDPYLMTFFSSYYNALADGDEDAVAGFYDSANIEISSSVSSLVNSFSVTDIYTACGIKDDEMAAFVRVYIVFNDIDTAAPAMNSYYLKKDNQGEYHICSDMDSDYKKLGYMTLMSEEEPVKTYLSDTEEKLKKAISSDEMLKELYEKIDASVNG